MPEARRILLVRLSHLGDVVCALPVYHALRSSHPDAELAWVVQEEFADLLRGLPGLGRVFLFGRRDGVAAWPRLASELGNFDPDWTVDAQGNLKSALVTLSSGAERRTGLARADWREPLGSVVLNDRAPRADGPHVMDRMRALARHVSSSKDRSDDLLRTDPGLTDVELAAGRELARRLLPEGGVVVALAPRAQVKSYPLQLTERTARGLAGAGHAVLVLSGPAERAEGEELERALADVASVRHWVGQRGPRELAALLTVGAERGAVLVGCDSAPAHLAAACGLPVVLLAGPQDPRRTGPWPVPSSSGDRHAIVAAADAPDCAPCLSRRCAHPEGPVCMARIRPEDVTSRALERAVREHARSI